MTTRLAIRRCARPVPVDAEGLCIAQSAALYPRAKLAVVTRTLQFSVAVRMSLTRRNALPEWRRVHRSWIIEGDHDDEFRYGEQRVRALCSMRARRSRAACETFSKSLGAGLQLGFIVLPDAMVDAFTRARALKRSSVAPARFIVEGHCLPHLRRCANCTGRARLR